MPHSFGSDNHSGIHPRILEAIATANESHVPAYGNDIFTVTAKDTICDLLGHEAEVLFMFNGTGANVMALRAVTRPYNAIICTDTAHIWENECGAPAAHTGCKVIAVPTPDGKLTAELARPHLTNFNNPHCNRPRVISITQPTELGTLYSVDEIRELADLAHAHDMVLHMDGTRIANAIAATGASLSEMVTETGVDLLCFGGTKNGMMLGEAVVFMDTELGANAKYERKQLMQLASKMRFIAAQFESYLADDLWIKNALHSNAMAAYLAAELANVPQVRIMYPVQTNGMFVEISREAVDKLREEGYYFNVKENDPCQVRWMCSFDTTKDDIDQLVATLKRIFSE